MFAVLGMVFCAQILIEEWPTIALVRPGPPEKHYHGLVHTCSQCLASFFLLKSLLRMVYTRLGEAHTLQKTLPWPGLHMFECLAWFFVLKSLLTDGLHSPW